VQISCRKQQRFFVQIWRCCWWGAEEVQMWYKRGAGAGQMCIKGADTGEKVKLQWCRGERSCRCGKEEVQICR
jgi:hypothetical protein